MCNDPIRVPRKSPNYSPRTTGPLQCDLCQRTFADRRKLHQHMYLHIREANFPPCNRCDQKHENEHNAATDTLCEECDMPFVTAKQRGIHFKAMHMRSTAYAADVTTAFTVVAPTTKATTADRERRRDLRWQCTQCDKSLISKRALKTHLMCEHGCLDFSVDQRTGRVTDLLANHGVRHDFYRVYYRCNLCAFSNKSKYTVLDHLLLLHSKESPYMCSRCPQTFRRKSDLGQHRLQQHGGGRGLAAAAEQPTTFVCEQCGERFERKHSLDAHLIAAHSAERPYKCFVDGCPKSYRSVIGRRQHYLAAHEVPEAKDGVPPVPPIACNFCAKRFYYSSGINEHMRKSHPTEMVRCDVCDDQPQMEWQKRVQHVRDVHPELMKRGRRGFLVFSALSDHSRVG